jgi:hypothetical protein
VNGQDKSIGDETTDKMGTQRVTQVQVEGTSINGMCPPAGRGGGI